MFPVAKEGLNLIIPTFILAVALYLTNLQALAIIFFIVFLFLIFFFRNPKRNCTFSQDIILSPADGKIISIENINNPSYINENALKVSIFLSIFDVHITRSPYNGTVEKIEYKKGQFTSAFKDCASKNNENNTIYIKCDNFKLIVKQIAGFIARRIVCNAEENMYIERGQKLGIIKFGSRVELLIPQKVKLKVKTGQKVIGGKTIIGELN